MTYTITSFDIISAVPILTGTEDTEHFLLHYPHFTTQCRDLFDLISNLSDVEIMAFLQKNCPIYCSVVTQKRFLWDPNFHFRFEIHDHFHYALRFVEVVNFCFCCKCLGSSKMYDPFFIQLEEKRAGFAKNHWDSIIIEFNFFQHVMHIGDSWLRGQLLSTFVT